MTEVSRLSLVALDAAIQEVVDQADYYEQTGGSELANRWDTAVSSSIQSLRVMPDRGSPCFFLPAKLSNLRRIPIKGFEHLSVFYRVSWHDRSVTVIAVLHSAQDIVRILETPRT